MDEPTPSNTLQWMEEMLTLERSSFVNRIGVITVIVKELSAAVATALSVLTSANKGALLVLQLTASLVVAVSVLLVRWFSAVVIGSTSLFVVLKRLLGLSAHVPPVSAVYSGFNAIRHAVADILAYLQMNVATRLIAGLVAQVDSMIHVVTSVIFPRFISAAYQMSLSAMAYGIDVGVSVVSTISSSIQAVVSANVIRKLLVHVYSASMSLYASASLLGSLVSGFAVSVEKTVTVSARRYISALSSALTSVFSVVSVGSKLISAISAGIQLVNIISPRRGIVPASVTVVSSSLAMLRNLVRLSSALWHYTYVSVLPNPRLAFSTTVSMIFGIGIQLKVLLKPAVMSRYGRAFSSMRSTMSIIVLGRRTGGHRR